MKWSRICCCLVGKFIPSRSERGHYLKVDLKILCIRVWMQLRSRLISGRFRPPASQTKALGFNKISFKTEHNSSRYARLLYKLQVQN